VVLRLPGTDGILRRDDSWHAAPEDALSAVRPLRRALRTVALVALTVVITFAAAEVGITIGYDLLLRSSLYTYDSEMGFRVRPHAPWGAERTNEFGFNDRDRAHEKPPGVVRVLMLGDSFNWAGGTTRNYTAVMQRTLASLTGDRVEVINAGYPGTHPGEELIALRRFGLQYDPDVVVLGFFVGNDILDASPWRRVLPIGGELTPIDTRTDVITTLAGRPLVWRSHLVRLAQAQLRAWRRARSQGDGARAASLAIPDEVYWAIEHEHMRIADPADDGLAANERYVLDAVAAMQALVRAHGARFVVAAFPDAFQVDAELRRRIVERYGLDAARFDWDRPERRLADFCRARGIEFYDLLPAFRAASGAGAELYLPNEPHWNDAGNALAAQLLADALRLQ
jgi:hypothetical protein